MIFIAIVFSLISGALGVLSAFEKGLSIGDWRGSEILALGFLGFAVAFGVRA